MTRKEIEKRNENCAKEIRQFLLDNEMWIDTYIYFNGKCYGTSYTDENGKERFVYNNKEHLVEFEADPSRCVEYYSKDGITMTFEGDLYDVINYYWESRELAELKKKFDAIFEKYGLYYEQGYAWSLSTAEL